MRHKKAGRKFGRSTSHRRAMFRNLVGNLVMYERIETTDAKAKELRRIAERLLTKAVRLGDDLTVDEGKLKEEDRLRVIGARLAARRQVASYLPHRGTKTLSDGTTEQIDLVKKLFEVLAPRFIARVKAAEGKGGGYTRMMKLGVRRGDNAEMAVIEFLPEGA
jgi:large subunit ribosomal protein L17